MTNFETVKDKIWKAAQKQNKQKFDKECDNLMEKAVGDWWRIGWNICPKDANDLVDIFERTARRAHREWLKAMKRGDAPAEDVSPGEGFAWCAKIIRDLRQDRDSKKRG